MEKEIQVTNRLRIFSQGWFAAAFVVAGQFSTILSFLSKHPAIQTKSKHIKYFCCDDVRSLMRWIVGIRCAKVVFYILVLKPLL